MTIALKAGQRVTLLTIDDALAMTHRYELEVRRVLEPQAVGYEGRRQRVAVVRQRGKRKEFFLDLEADAILLDGWGLPFRSDTDGNNTLGTGGCVAFHGNACYNLLGAPEVIRECLESRAVLPVRDGAKAKVIVWATDAAPVLLYPDIDTHHAVINRMKDDAATAAD